MSNHFNQPEYAIQTSGLSKKYPAFTLNDINLTLPSGCIMGLIGENGAGKTTTIKLLLNAIKKSGGSVQVLGHDTTEKNYHTVKEEIGVVLDEVSFPENMKAKQVHKVLKNTFRNWDRAAFTEYMTRFELPDDKPFKTFSKGMKMKFGLACALAHHPRLLILDEVTSGLDPVAREDVLEIFSDFTRTEEHSILISSHIVGDLEKICDYIAFFHKGEELLCEEKDRLLEEFGLIQCSREQLSELNPKAIIGKRENSYGVNALVRRSGVPETFHLSPVTLEEIFVYMVKDH